MVAIAYHIMMGPDSVKFDPMHCDIGLTMSNNVIGMPNLGFSLDRRNPTASESGYETGFIKTTFAEALSNIEQWIETTPTPCSLAIEHSFNPDSRKIGGAVKVLFDDTPKSGEYKVTLLVVEDSIVYKQYEYGMGADFGVPEVDIAKGYHETWYHNHVVRDGIIVGDTAWGESFATNPAKDDQFSIPITYDMPTRYEYSGPGTISIPSQYDPEAVQDEQVYLVAYVTLNDSIVMNAAKIDLLDGETSLEQASFQGRVQQLAVVNSGNSLAVHGTGLSEVKLYSTSGRLISQAVGSENRAALTLNNLSAGVYLLQGITENGVSTQSVIVK